MGWLVVALSPLTPDKMWMGKDNTAQVAVVGLNV